MNNKFRHAFGDTINTVCACGSEVETTEHFLLRCHLYSPQRLELFENLEKVDSSFLNLKVKEKVSFLLSKRFYSGVGTIKISKKDY